MVDANNPSGGKDGIITFENLSGDWGKGNYVIGGRTSYGSVSSAQFYVIMVALNVMVELLGLLHIALGRVVLKLGKVLWARQPLATIICNSATRSLFTPYGTDSI